MSLKVQGMDSYPVNKLMYTYTYLSIYIYLSIYLYLYSINLSISIYLMFQVDERHKQQWISALQTKFIKGMEP